MQIAFSQTLGVLGDTRALRGVNGLKEIITLINRY